MEGKRTAQGQPEAAVAADSPSRGQDLDECILGNMVKGLGPHLDTGSPSFLAPFALLLASGGLPSFPKPLWLLHYWSS